MPNTETNDAELEEAAPTTQAGATLAPDSQNGAPGTKAGMMASMMGAMNGMKKSDLVDFFNQTMAQFGPNNFPGADAVNTTAQNMDSIKAKASVKEDIEDMFAGEEITEEFKTKVETIFEAAVHARVELEIARINEEQETEFNNIVEEYKTDLSDKVDEYLSYAVEQWVEENRVALENGLKLEVFENFFTGLKNLFIENNVSIPDEEVSLVDELEDTIGNLEDRVNEEIEKNIRLSNLNEELIKNGIIVGVTANLTDSQKEKFNSLVEGVEYENLNEFESKLGIIKETYFNKKSPKSATAEIVGVDVLNEDKNIAPVTGPMAVYAEALSRTIKN